MAAYGGGTGIAVPLPLQSLGLPGYLELGVLYKVYMVMLVVFCTNAINILAGVNGLEAGQTFVIACAVMFHNVWELSGHAGASDPSVFSILACWPGTAVVPSPARVILYPMSRRPRVRRPGMLHVVARLESGNGCG